MKILIINPNSDPSMTKAIQKTADNFIYGDYEVTCKLTPGAPKFIETYEDELQATPGMIQLVKESEDFDAFIVACHDDPNLNVIKEITTKPVIGIGEASMKMASMLGHRFSVMSTSKHSIPIKEELIRKYHLQNVLASIRAPDEDMKKFSNKKMYLKVAKLAVEEDMAEVIVLGCAGMTGLDKYLQKALNVPVLDGVICALIITMGLLKYGVSISKKRRFNPNWE
ncbi:MAG: aspartate/glutamate racemase family protein [Candidatus Thorarchaeota archaeon]